MKKLFSCLILSLMGMPFVSNTAKADKNYFINNGDIIEIFESSVSDSVTTFTKLTTFDRASNNNAFFDNGSYWYDQSLNKLFFQEKDGSTFRATGRHWEYDLNTETWAAITISSDSSDSVPYYGSISSSYSDVISTNTSNISTNTSNISTNTSNIKALGEGVAGSTALTAALTALPQTAKESKLSCGVGTGAYSSRYAVGFGCASKVNERVDINAGGSYVFGGSKSYGGGTLDSGVVKAGFVFKLGELSKPTQISFNDKKIIDKKLSTLEENNKNLNAELKLSKAKNDEIISQNQKLLARLEKLENIALKFQSSSEMISVATKD